MARNKMRSVLIGAAACFVVAGSVNASTVNFDVPGGDGGSNYAGTGADTGGATNEYWNPVVANGTTSAGKQSDGTTPTAITFTEAENHNFNGGQAANPLFQPFAISTSQGGLHQSLNNVPGGLYDLFLYGVNGQYGDRGTTFTVSGLTSYGTQTETSTSNYAPNNFIQGQNFVEYTNISPTALGSITINYNNALGDASEGDFNGLQLVSVPEPTSIGLLGLGGVVLIGRRRRR